MKELDIAVSVLKANKFPGYVDISSNVIHNFYENIKYVLFPDAFKTSITNF